MKTESLSPTFADTTHASVRGRSRPVAHQASGRTFQVDWESRDAAPDWDAFVESFPDGHHEQTSLWGQVRKRHGWNIGRIIVRSAVPLYVAATP